MRDVTPFIFNGHEVRTVLADGEPAFVGKDVCERLGYTNPNKAMNDHCRGLTKRYPIVDALGRTQEVRVLSEPNVLRLIVRSKLPEAEAFERWVFDEVLPSIRKTGGYMVAAAHETPEELALRAMSVLQATVERQKAQIEATKAELAVTAPKAVALDRISTAEGAHGLYEAAKILQVGPKSFVQWLAMNAWIYKRTGSRIWIARQERINQGVLWHKVSTYTDPNGEEKTRNEVKVTPKGLTRLAREVPGASLDPDLSPVPVSSRPLAPAMEAAL